MHEVPFDGTFSVSQCSTVPPAGTLTGKEAKRALKTEVKKIAALQRTLYASKKNAVLLVFQAMDAAGKDSTIRSVMTGVNPAGFQVTSFKAPSKNELKHDFLWRTTRALPEKGRIGIFNRSQYEETLVVKVHPEYLAAQHCDEPDDTFWEQRYASIRSQEQHLARNGTVILKFWLNVSRPEQMRRFARRLELPEKNWKFSAGDLEESEHWDTYMTAYEDVLNATSRPWAPWYAIPADDKPYMRLIVGQIVARALGGMGLEYPSMAPDEKRLIPAYQQRITQTLDLLEG